MGELEQRIRLELVNICNKINKCTSPKLTMCYLTGYEYLRDFSQENGLDIDIPPIYKDVEHIYENPKLEKAEDTRFYQNYNAMLSINENIANMGKNLFDRYGQMSFGQFTTKISFNDALEMANGFFMDYDLDIANFFNSLLKNHYIQFPKADNTRAYGITYIVNCLQKAYISVYPSDNIEFVATIVHEVIHAYVDSFIYNQSYEEISNCNINCLHEIYSEFIEIMLLDYLEKIKFNAKDTRLYGGTLNSFMIADAMDLGDFINNYFPEDLAMNGGLYYQFQEIQCYVYGKIIARLYYDMYHQSPNYVKEQILKIMIDSYKYDKPYLLNNYGFKQKDLYDEQKLIRYMQKYFPY